MSKLHDIMLYADNDRYEHARLERINDKLKGELFYNAKHINKGGINSELADLESEYIEFIFNVVGTMNHKFEDRIDIDTTEEFNQLGKELMNREIKDIQFDLNTNLDAIKAIAALRGLK